MLGGGFPLTRYKNQGFKSTNNQFYVFPRKCWGSWISFADSMGPVRFPFKISQWKPVLPR